MKNKLKSLISFRWTGLLALALLPAEAVTAPVSAESWTSSDNGDGTFRNPLIWADVPDLSIIRVGDAYYMVSTTMHLTPGCPIMKSRDLVNWEIVNYVYDQLDEADAFALKNGENDYASGSWAANIRYDQYQKQFYIIFASNTTNKSYIFSTADIENGPWHRNVVDKCYDPGLLFEDTGTGYKRYVIYGQGKHYIREIFVDKNFDATLGPEKVLMENANVENPPQGLHAEGAHAYKIGEYYYLFMIQGQGWQRQEIVWRSKTLEPESFEVRRIFTGNIVGKDGKEVMNFTGIAQGGIVNTPDGKWYAPLFQDYGSVGRMPVLIPVDWKDGWPVLGNNGKSVDEILPKPIQGQPKTSIVVSDEFNNGSRRRILADTQVGTGIKAGFSAQQLGDLASQNATAPNLIQNGDFQSGLSTGWDVNGGNDMAQMSIETDAQGQRFLKISRRKATIAGPSQNLAGKLEQGASYKVSVRLKYNDYQDETGRTISAVDARDFKITVRIGGQFSDVAIGKVQKGQWMTLQGTYTVPKDADVQNAVLFFETTWVPTNDIPEAENKTKHNFDFVLDDVSMTKDAMIQRVAENEYAYNGSNLGMAWQWNHNPNNNLWSLIDRKGYIRFKSGLLSNNIQNARNTLTQRTFGPTCSANVAVEVGQMKNGDVAGLSSFQNQYGFVGVKMENGQKSLVMQRAQAKDDAEGKVCESIPLKQERVYLKVDCDFRNKTDKAYFYFSLDGKNWQKIGDTLQMNYDWPHFVGQRFALFYYSTQELGGYVDFDYFHVSDKIALNP